MTITYPLTMPSSPGFSLFTPHILSVVAVGKSPSNLKAQKQPSSGKSWGIDVTLPVMQREEAAPWLAFLASLNGPEGTFYCGDPLARTPLGTASGTPKASGTQTEGSQSLSSKGWTHGAAGVLLKGDFIQVGTGLHMVLGNVDADGSGNATIDVWPGLRAAHPDDTTIITSNPVGIFQLTNSDYPLYTTSATQQGFRLYSVAFTAVEAR